MIDFILNFLFPKFCLSCGGKGDYLCWKCAKKLKILTTQNCPECGKNSLNGFTHKICLKERGLNGVYGLFLYQKPISILIHQFKYQFAKEVGETLAEFTVKAFTKTEILEFWRKNEFIFTPVPLFLTRKLWRGFNQSELTLNRICEELKLPFKDKVLTRSKWTRDQARLKLHQRKKNVKNAFAVCPYARVKGKNFVVFDDVFTTGATLKACAKALKLKGAKSVWGLSLCR